MSDNIDIEEHDILDNPLIRSIFPDISVVKEELMQYDDVTNINFDVEAEGYQQHQIDQNINEDLHDSLGSIIDDTDTIGEARKQILGSSLSITYDAEASIHIDYNKKELKICSPTVLLQDIKSLLHSNRYCEMCQTLFPNESQFDDHKHNLHKMVTKSKETYESSPSKKIKLSKRRGNNDLKSNGNHAHVKIKQWKSSHQCEFCKNMYSSKRSLIRHYKSCHKRNLVHSDQNVANIESSETLSAIKSNSLIKKPTRKHQRDTNERRQKTESESSELKFSTPVDSNKSNNEHNLSNLYTKPGKYVYECVYCTYMLRSPEAYRQHIHDKHKIDEVPFVNKVTFDQQCKYCSLKHTNECYHNKHLNNHHSDLIHNEITATELEKPKNTHSNMLIADLKKYEDFVLDSIIYACLGCNVHFLSSYNASQHEKHIKMDNWECNICEKIFKEQDQFFHLKQHQLSKYLLNVITIQNSTLILYNCTKCGIHFVEDRYLHHYTKCDDSHVADSVYCNKCDILIDKCSYSSHVTEHTNGINAADYVIIVAGLITQTSKNEDYVPDSTSNKDGHKEINRFIFCPTCKCYFSDGCPEQKLHGELSCSKMPKSICHLCGLVLTDSAMALHKKQHRKYNSTRLKNNLQDFIFCDLHGMQICPPIPEYPCCYVCNINFVSKNAVAKHVCSETDYLMCTICNAKLSENAHKLHMNFHNYDMPNKITTSILSETLQLENKHHNIENHIQQSNGDHELINSQNMDNFGKIVYCCKNCKITVHSYDEVIEHCQDHYNPLSTIFPTLKTCSKCSLRIKIEEYEMHTKVHLRPTDAKVITYDPTYFILDKNTWMQHISASLTNVEYEEFVGQSIYEPECRIRMELIQDGPPHLTLYECGKCRVFINPDNLLAHVKVVPHKGFNKVSCLDCGLSFISPLNKHKEVYKQCDNLKTSFRIVLINSVGHEKYNRSILRTLKQHIIYQCRTCEGVVDKLSRNVHQCVVDDLKKCPRCGLLVYNVDYQNHLSKHTSLSTFKSDNIKVVLFGSGSEYNINKKLFPKFDGLVYDYTLYKCAKCNVCVKNTLGKVKHICVTDNAKLKCPICDIYVCSTSTLKNHMAMHNTDPEYNLDNIKVILYNLTKREGNGDAGTTAIFSNSQNVKKIRKETVDPVLNETNLKIEKNTVSEALKIHDNDNYNKTPKAQKESVKLFKSACKLHFLDEINLIQHIPMCNPKCKVTAQTCLKCGLLFNPKELFSHLLTHHGNRHKLYMFEIVDLNTADKVNAK